MRSRSYQPNRNISAYYYGFWPLYATGIDVMLGKQRDVLYMYFVMQVDLIPSQSAFVFVLLRVPVLLPLLAIDFRLNTWQDR